MNTLIWKRYMSLPEKVAFSDCVKNRGYSLFKKTENISILLADSSMRGMKSKKKNLSKRKIKFVLNTFSSELLYR